MGLQHLTTDTRVCDDYDYDDERIASTNHLLVHFLGPRKKIRSSVMLDIGIRYIQGGVADYLMPGDIEIVWNNVNYFVSRSRTDMLIPRISVSFAF